MSIDALRSLKLFLIVSGIASLGGYVFFSLQAWNAPSRGPGKTHQSSERQRPNNGLAKLDIPRAGLSVMVMEATDDATLRVTVGHIPGTRLPGQTGNVVSPGTIHSFEV